MIRSAVWWPACRMYSSSAQGLTQPDADLWPWEVPTDRGHTWVAPYPLWPPPWVCWEPKLHSGLVSGIRKALLQRIAPWTVCISRPAIWEHSNPGRNDCCPQNLLGETPQLGGQGAQVWFLFSCSQLLGHYLFFVCLFWIYPCFCRLEELTEPFRTILIQANPLPLAVSSWCWFFFSLNIILMHLEYFKLDF